MASTILSSLGEPILHRNSLATVTSSWVVIRQGASDIQSVVAIQSIAELKPIKTTRLYPFVLALGCLVVALATLCSKESDGATLPFGILGFTLLANAQTRRQVALALVVGDDAIETVYGSVAEAATLVATVRTIRNGSLGADRTPYTFLTWVRAYIGLLV